MCGCMSHVCVYMYVCLMDVYVLLFPVDLCGHVDVLVHSSASPNRREQEHIWKEP